MGSYLLAIPILLPIICGSALYFLRFTREVVGKWLITVTVFINSAIIWMLIINCSSDSFTVFELTEKLAIQLRLDGLGRFFAAIIATLWPMTTIYAFEYMRNEERKSTFFCFFVMSFGVTMGVCSAGNMLTMYCFYEFLTLATLPLVIHTMTKAAIRAARTYLCFSIGGAAFAFIGMVYLIANGSSSGFMLGGIMSGSNADETMSRIIYVIAFMGFGVKAAVFPVHSWLPKASVAPTPVTALLHAVAVVKSGAFAIIRLTYFCFGTELLAGTWAQTVVLCVAAFTVFYGSSMALKQGHFKRRLAYSTVANLSYIVLGATMMTPQGLAAGLSHMAFHAIIKILGFFCAGAVMHNTEREYVYEFDGLGRKMPVTFACYTVSALALTGIPPLNGFVSKWNLLTSTLSASVINPTAYVGAAALLISALLTAMYMLTPCVRAYFPNKDTNFRGLDGIREVNAYMTVPMLILAAACILTGIFAGPIVELCGDIALGIV